MARLNFVKLLIDDSCMLPLVRLDLFELHSLCCQFSADQLLLSADICEPGAVLDTPLALILDVPPDACRSNDSADCDEYRTRPDKERMVLERERHA